MEIARANPPLLYARFALLLAVLLTYSPTLSARFGGWDDAMNLTDNADFHPPTFASILRYWSEPAFDLYAPATFTAWGAISAIAYHDDHLEPLPFHLANLLLHITAAIIAFDLLLLLSDSVFASLLGAMIFALHPLQVESVAWVSGLKDLLAGALSLLALRLYLKRDQRIGYLLATLAFVLAMLAKSSAIVTPAIALLLDVFFQRRNFRQSLKKLLPWMVLTIPIVVMARRAQPAADVGPAVPMLQRPLIALDALGFYLWKLFWPLRLGVDYGRTPQSVMAHPSMLWLVPLLVAALVIALWFRGKRWPGIAMMIFILALAPMLGLAAFDFQAYSTVTDHYVYLAMLGPALAVAFWLKTFDRNLDWMAGILICCALAALSFRQARTWHDGLTISNQALLANPQSWMSQEYIAAIDLESNDPQQAIAHAQIAAGMNPQLGKAFDTLGGAYARLNLRGHAAAAYRQAIALSSTDLAARLGLASVLTDAGQFPQAIEQYKIALRIEPTNIIALSNLAGVYGEMGQFDRAIQLYDLALSINPGFTPALIGRQTAIQRKNDKGTR